VLGVGNVDAFALAKMADGSGDAGLAVTGLVVQFAAAVIDGIGIVIGDSFSAPVIQSALEAARNGLGLLKGLPFVGGGHGRARGQAEREAERNEESVERLHSPEYTGSGRGAAVPRDDVYYTS
jgi:hypothetical protein